MLNSWRTLAKILGGPEVTTKSGGETDFLMSQGTHVQAPRPGRGHEAVGL